jgi:putative aminopeptidase FrvX
MPIDVPLLARICEAPGAPGFEKEIRKLVLKELKGLADQGKRGQEEICCIAV